MEERLKNVLAPAQGQTLSSKQNQLKSDSKTAWLVREASVRLFGKCDSRRATCRALLSVVDKPIQAINKVDSF